MADDSSTIDTRACEAGRVTYWFLMIAAIIPLELYTPLILVLIGVIESSSRQAWTLVLGLSLVYPAIAVIPTVLVLSLSGLARGPDKLRLRIVVWWMTVLVGFALSSVTTPSAAINPYLGTSEPWFSSGDAVLLGCLAVLIALPSIWLVRMHVEKRSHDGQSKA